MEEDMQKYIGVKIVEAMAMTADEATEYLGRPLNPTEGSSDYGYLVRYPDGYESWCPAQQFEEANRIMSGMTFGHAIEAAKKGQGFKLPQWGDDVYISMQSPDENSKMTAPYLYVTSRFGCVPWIPTMIEILSDDWTITE